MPEADLDVLRVFVGPGGAGGNPLGVFLDATGFPESDFQRVAADLGFSETVFVEDRAEARLRIFTPAVELPLAGHPLVGTSWLLHREGDAPRVLRPRAGDVPTWQAQGLTWVRARPALAPRFEFVEVDAPEDVERLSSSPGQTGHTVAWAWIDEPAGKVRARAFLPDYGVDEDEATGAAALRLCALLGRALEIRQGVGSVLRVRPAGSESADLAGVVAQVERRRYAFD